MKQYYSSRKGLINDLNIDLEILKQLFMSKYRALDREGYFQKYFGYDCTDGFIEGLLGEDVSAALFISLKKWKVWPIYKEIAGYSEEDFFDMLEFLHDHSSKPTKTSYHDWNNCGNHVNDSDDNLGKEAFRNLINPILKDFKDGFEISKDGEILHLPQSGLENLFTAELPTKDDDNILERVNAAKSKFRRVKASMEDRRDALRDLADVLEFLRPDLNKVLTKKHDSDLFNIANSYGIRHHNENQKTDYNKPAWQAWIFYYYLSTIHLAVRLIEKQTSN